VEPNFADHASAPANGSTEAAVSIEPFLPRIAELEVGTVYERRDEPIPS
jgi:hypothetical protein